MQQLWSFVLGFSLEVALETPLGRALAENDEPCKQSCDAGHDRHCDQQDSTGRYSLSCDLHPTTSCDSDCHYPPPPPLDPWMGASGTYPSPPPPPPPPEDETLLAAAWIFFLVVLLVFLCCTCYGVYHYSYNPKTKGGSRNGRERIAYWCCCFLPCWRERGDHWDQEERDARKEFAMSVGATGAAGDVPPVMLR